MPADFAPAADAPVVVEGAAAAARVAAAPSLAVSGWDFPGWPGVSLAEVAQPPALSALVDDIKTRLAGAGFCVVRLSSIIGHEPEGVAAAAATLLASAIGKPFRVYENNPGHWRNLGADPQRPPNRSEGIGLQLPHHDFCNAEAPPDVVCLLCLRPDPLGGGASLVARMAGIEAELEPAEVEQLSRPVFRDGQVVNLSGVGHDANPFAIIAPEDARFRYRFVGHLLESAPEPAAKAAVHALVAALKARMHTIPLAAGDLLLVDQHLAVHGRAALGQQQESLPIASRRRLLLSFLRTATAA
ncbi:MAG: TauD/TfdA family dioxygenase [Thiohalocapsa sp.]